MTEFNVKIKIKNPVVLETSVKKNLEEILPQLFKFGNYDAEVEVSVANAQTEEDEEDDDYYDYDYESDYMDDDEDY